MAVLIDGISKEDLEEVIVHARYGANNATIGSGWDIKELVRCEECKHYEKGGTCSRHGIRITMMPEDFCSSGKKKDDVL